MRTTRQKWILVLAGLLTIGSIGGSEARAQHARGHHGGPSYGHRYSPGYGRGYGYGRRPSYGVWLWILGYGYAAPRPLFLRRLLQRWAVWVVLGLWIPEWVRVVLRLEFLLLQPGFRLFGQRRVLPVREILPSSLDSTIRGWAVGGRPPGLRRSYPLTGGAGGGASAAGATSWVGGGAGGSSESDSARESDADVKTGTTDGRHWRYNEARPEQPLSGVQRTWHRWQWAGGRELQVRRGSTRTGKMYRPSLGTHSPGRVAGGYARLYRPQFFAPPVQYARPADQ